MPKNTNKKIDLNQFERDWMTMSRVVKEMEHMFFKCRDNDLDDVHIERAGSYNQMLKCAKAWKAKTGSMKEKINLRIASVVFFLIGLSPSIYLMNQGSSVPAKTPINHVANTESSSVENLLATNPEPIDVGPADDWLVDELKDPHGIRKSGRSAGK